MIRNDGQQQYRNNRADRAKQERSRDSAVCNARVPHRCRLASRDPSQPPSKNKRLCDVPARGLPLADFHHNFSHHRFFQGRMAMRCNSAPRSANLPSCASENTYGRSDSHRRLDGGITQYRVATWFGTLISGLQDKERQMNAIATRSRDIAVNDWPDFCACISAGIMPVGIVQCGCSARIWVSFRLPRACRSSGLHLPEPSPTGQPTISVTTGDLEAGHVSHEISGRAPFRCVRKPTALTTQFKLRRPVLHALIEFAAEHATGS